MTHPLTTCAPGSQSPILADREKSLLSLRALPEYRRPVTGPPPPTAVHGSRKVANAQKIARFPPPDSNFREEAKSTISLLSQWLAWPDQPPQSPSSRRPWWFIQTQAKAQIDEGEMFIGRRGVDRDLRFTLSPSEMARSRRRSKSVTVGGDGLDSRRWRSNRSYWRLETCPASPEEPIATFFLLNGGRERKGEGGGGGVVAPWRGKKKKKRKERKYVGF
ncbi:hypothetical protein JCGZ_08808 [Jatropha curcas]|uniref:Uncharacterized protein n=1 Tax=Jatropha curcas TaxID=180498 RepID=A0A067KWF5_JATCU|nr:hypothetical protein JCGZ_08808 [Jatropha curcas]